MPQVKQISDQTSQECWVWWAKCGSKAVNYFIPSTFEKVPFYVAKGPFKCDEVKDLEMGRLSGISQVGQCNHMTLLKKEDRGVRVKERNGTTLHW